MDNSEIGFLLYYVLTGIFIYICIIQIKKDNKK